MAIIDQEIQSGINIVSQPRLTRDSAGNLYSVYIKSSDGVIFVAYSQDGGLTWAEVTSTIVGTYPALAIDSTDILHVVYLKTSTTTAKYKSFTISGGWGSEESVSTVVPMNNRIGEFALAVDSSDNVHATWTQNTSDIDDHEAIFYNKRTAGTWGTATLVSSDPEYTTSDTQSFPQIAIDSNNYIYIVWNNLLNLRIYYIKYTSFWTSAVQLGTTSLSATLSKPSLAVDSLDNVHVVWGRSTNVLAYVKYTKLTDTWSAEAVVTTSAVVKFPTIAVDSSDKLDVVFDDLTDIWFIQNTGSWGAESKILDASGANAFTKPYIQSTVYPLIGGVHTNIPTAGYQFTYINTVAGVNILRFYSSTDIDFPAPQTQNYSREENVALPTNSAVLDNLFTTAEYTEVATENSIYADQTGTDDYSIFLFKDKGTVNTDDIHVSWTGQTNVAPSTSIVYLQVYNINSATWETVDSDNTTGANVNFTLTGDITENQTYHYDDNLWVTCRLYQLAV